MVDQAALHGLLRKVRDLGMPLLSVSRVEPSQADASDVNETHHYCSKKEGVTHESFVLAKPNNLEGTFMKAIVCTHYGSPDVLKLEEIEKPTSGDDEILVKVHAASVNYSNLALVRGKPFVARLGFGLLKPKLRIPRN